MKYKLYAVLFSLCMGTVGAERKKIDRIRLRLHHPEGLILICDSDLRPDLSGRSPSVRDAFLRKLILLDGKKLKISVSEAELDRHLARVQERLKMTRDDLIAFFKENGFTFEQGKKELEESLFIETTVEHRLRSKVYVSRTELEKYHQENPVNLYDIRQAYVPFTGSKSIQKVLIDRDIASGTIGQTVKWESVITLQENDFSPEKAYIKKLTPGSVERVQETDEGMVLLQLVDKKVVSFEERKNEIASQLSGERYKKGLTQYYDTLIEDARPYLYLYDAADLTTAP